MRYLACMLIWLVVCVASAPAETLRLDYEGFTMWLDCDRRGAVKFRYNAQRDQGTFPRHKNPEKSHTLRDPLLGNGGTLSES